MERTLNLKDLRLGKDKDKKEKKYRPARSRKEGRRDGGVEGWTKYCVLRVTNRNGGCGQVRAVCPALAPLTSETVTEDGYYISSMACI